MLLARHRLQTSDLLVSYLEDGPSNGWPVILTHGFPYDVHAFDEVVPLLVEQGARVIRPFVRGFGPTRFLSPSIMRSGQQAALGRDLIEILCALHMEGAIVAGFDWGGLASCAAAALWPEKIGGLVSYAGYDIVDIAQQQDGFRFWMFAAVSRRSGKINRHPTLKAATCLEADSRPSKPPSSPRPAKPGPSQSVAASPSRRACECRSRSTFPNR